MCAAPLSASLNMATVGMPRRFAVVKIRHAISPRFATKSLSIAGGEDRDDDTGFSGVLVEKEEEEDVLLLVLERARVFKSCSQRRQVVGAVEILRRLVTAIAPFCAVYTV